MQNLMYSANFEDVIINRVFSHIEKGFYIDIGAYHPISCSNTCRLYQRGWRGIVIEPQVKFHEQWRLQRPEDILLGCAVSDSVGEATFYDFTNNEQNCTIDENIALMLQKEGKKVETKTIQQTSIDQILADHPPVSDIHLLCIDVEGAEEKVLLGLNREQHRPWLIVLESTLPNRATVNYQSWEPLLTNSGYEFVYFDAINRFYLAKEHLDLKKFFTYPPCAWDNFIDYRVPHYQQLAQKYKNELDNLKLQLKKLSD
jgi:FkbM family methyltransferase